MYVNNYNIFLNRIKQVELEFFINIFKNLQTPNNA